MLVRDDSDLCISLACDHWKSVVPEQGAHSSREGAHLSIRVYLMDVSRYWATDLQ